MLAFLRHHSTETKSMYEDLGGESDSSIISTEMNLSSDCTTATEFDSEDLYLVLDNLSVSTCSELTDSSDECESSNQQYLNLREVFDDDDDAGEHEEEYYDSDPPAIVSEDDDEGTSTLDDISDQFEADVHVCYGALSGEEGGDEFVPSIRETIELSTDSNLDECAYVYYDLAIGRRYVADKNGNFLYRLESDGGRSYSMEDDHSQPSTILKRCEEEKDIDVDDHQLSAAAKGHFNYKVAKAGERPPLGELSSEKVAVDALMSSYQLSQLNDDFVGGKPTLFKSRLREVISQYYSDELRKPPNNAAFTTCRLSPETAGCGILPLNNTLSLSRPTSLDSVYLY